MECPEEAGSKLFILRQGTSNSEGTAQRRQGVSYLSSDKAPQTVKVLPRGARE
jgi:hypothetical protein